MRHPTALWCASLGLVGIIAAASAADARYDPGATAGEIRIGNIASYTGAAAAYATVARAEAAYFRMINDRGGINGRRISFISLDDHGDSNQALALTQRLVEQEQVLALFSTFGTDSNLAIRGYANEHHIPQLFVEASSALFDDPARFPWTMGFFPSYRTEGLAYADYLLRNRTGSKIAVLHEGSAAGDEFLHGLRDGLGTRATSMIVREATHRSSDPNVDAQLDSLKSSGADVFMNLTLGPMTTAAIRRAYDIGWHPLQFIPNASLSVAAFLEPAGLAKATGVISSARSRSWWHPHSDRDPQVREFLDWMAHYNPDANLRDQLNVAGYERAEALVDVLQRCGNDLTRDTVMAKAASLDLEIGMLRPGIRLTTARDDYQPIKQLFLIRFDGSEWTALDAVATSSPALNRP